ncbi:flagellar filament capping protein FliD [Thorsellia kenyensis]|uniref:Flagellar hook-associated protein 2 n=1 Tax=Thorsellia kenyensis TaxID=1549888 RepID=A0ABV6CBQ0_9GAMM
MAGISSLGVGSGLDLQGILDQLLASEQTRLKPLTDQKSSLNNQLTAWGVVKSSVAKLDAAAQNLAKIKELSTTSVTSSNENFTASVKAGANPGSYSVSVLELASGQVSQSTQSAGKDDVLITSTGDTKISFASPSAEDGTFEITLEAGEYTLDDIRKKINASDDVVRAEIVYDGSGQGYLALSSRSTGADSAFTVSVSGASSQKFDDIVASLNTNNVKDASDAVIQFNGVRLTSSTNAFENVVDGVSLTVKSLSGTSEITENGLTKTVYDKETLTISKDSKELKAAITAYVDAYNEVQTTIANQTKFVPGKPGEELSASNGDLLGNTALRGLQNQLRNQVTSVQDGVFSTLNSLGITLNTSDVAGTSTLKLEIDSKKLDKALEENSQAVIDFFIGDGEKTGYATTTSQQLSSIMNNSTGLFKTQEDSLNSLVKRVEQTIENTTSSIEANIESTRRQFEALDRMMAQMNSTSAYLTQQLSAISNQNK